MSDTPMTDEAQFGTGRVSVDFARRLEREVNAANERIQRLEEAGDAMERWCSDAVSADNWRKAKEDKP